MSVDLCVHFFPVQKKKENKNNKTFKQSLMLLLKCCFTSTETVGLLGTGAQDGHFDFHTAPEL